MPNESFYVDQGGNEFLIFRADSVPDDVATRLKHFTSINALIDALRGWNRKQSGIKCDICGDTGIVGLRQLAQHAVCSCEEGNKWKQPCA